MTNTHRDVRRVTPNDGNGRGTPALLEEPSVGDLFKSLSRDSSHLIRQEMNLAKTELKETGTRIGQAAAKLGVAVGVAIPGLVAVTAFLVVGLGDLMDNYWAAALIVGVVLLGVAAILAKRALNRLKESVGVPETVGTLREDAKWAKAEAQAFKREITA